MAAAAPGLSASSQESAICYNCGGKGHWVMACPEPTKEVPVGLQRSWHSKHQEGGQSSERSGPSQEKKGPVVTRYPPPPGQGPPGSRYGLPPPPPPPFSSGSPPPPPQGYAQPGYPPPPPFPGSFPPPPPAAYGQYPPSGPPPPPQYGQQPPYPPSPYPPPYPPSNYYPGAAPPPPTFPPGTYAPQSYGPPPPPPASGHYPPPYAGAIPPPPPEYHYPPGQPPSYGPPPPIGAVYPPPAGWNPAPYGAPPPPPISQTPLNGNKHRGKHSKHHNSKRPNSHRDRHGDKPEDRHGDRNRERHDRHRRGHDGASKNSPTQPERRQEHRGSKDEEVPKRNRTRSPAPRAKEEPKTDEWDFESAEDLKHVFLEVETRAADPVGIPLPSEYTDEPTIPPAYNAKSIKSAFFDADDLDGFIQSIRETESWPTFKRDPVFNHYPGMLLRKFPTHPHEYPTYKISTMPSPSAEIRLPPRVDRKQVLAEKASKEKVCNDRYGHPQYSPRARSPLDSYSSRHYHQDHHDRDTMPDRRHSKRSLENTPEDVDWENREPKRARTSLPSRGTPSKFSRGRDNSPVRKRTPSPSFRVEGDAWSPQAGESNARTPHESRRYDFQYDKSSYSREERVPYSKMRHDSGYHSGQSHEKMPLSSRDEGLERRSLIKQRRRSRSRSRASSSDRSDRSRSESPLTALEAELLGLTDEPSDSKPKMAAKRPVKRVKVAAAFSRRW